MSKEFDEIEDRIMNERAWGLGLTFAVIVVGIIGGAVGHALGYW